MSLFWCCGCQQMVDENFDGFGEIKRKWYCGKCFEEHEQVAPNSIKENNCADD